MYDPEQPKSKRWKIYPKEEDAGVGIKVEVEEEESAVDLEVLDDDEENLTVDLEVHAEEEDENLRVDQEASDTIVLHLMFLLYLKRKQHSTARNVFFDIMKVMISLKKKLN